MINRNEVRDYYSTELKLNDKAHDLEHCDKVYFDAMGIKQFKYPNENIDDLILLASYIHDLKCHVDRKDHHILAVKYIHENIYKDKFLTTLDKDKITMLVDAVYKHRASLKDINRNTPLAKIMYVADKGKPDLDSYIKRSIKYHDNKQNQAENVYNHMVEKFSRNGYAKMDDLTIEMYGSGVIEKFYNDIDNLTIDYVEKLIPDTIAS